MRLTNALLAGDAQPRPPRLRRPVAGALARLRDLLGGHAALDHFAAACRGRAIASVGRPEASGRQVEPHMRADVVVRHATCEYQSPRLYCAGAWPRSAASRYQRIASAASLGRPRPSSDITPSPNWAEASPCSAARRHQATASASSAGPPRRR